MGITFEELARDLTIELMRKSGVREWEDAQAREQITMAAMEIAANIITAGQFSMALPDNILVKSGTAIVLADTTDHAPGATAANNLGTRTDQIDLTSVGNAAARQSAKVDLGASRARFWQVTAAFEIAATPTAGNTIDLYWAPSASSTAGMGNPGNVSGSDAAYTGYSSNLTDAIKELQFIGSHICTANATTTVQVSVVGSFAPQQRYGTLVVVNNSGAALHSDAVEMSVRLEPIQGEITD